MHPILFSFGPLEIGSYSLGPITIYSYGVLLAAAYLTGLWLAVRRARAAGIDGNRIMDLLIWVIIAALVGAKALLFIVDFEHFTSSWEEFTTLLRSGGVFYGGLIAAILVCIYQLRKHRLALWPSADLFAPCNRAQCRVRTDRPMARARAGAFATGRCRPGWRRSGRRRRRRPTATAS